MIKLIAEIGINHNGDLDIAKKLIDLAAVAGFDYVKFQKRDADTCVPEHKKNEPKKTPWGDMTYYEYKKRIEFTKEQYDEIFNYCYGRGVNWFASVWDLPSVEFMKQYTSIVKVPSALITNEPVLRACRENFKTVIMSTGMSLEGQIETAVSCADPDVIMHTNSSYPALSADLRLNYIKWLIKKYPHREIGYSGHEFGLATTMAAAAIGATWIERHITLDHDMWGSDQRASVDPVGCIKLVRSVRDVELAMCGYGPRDIWPEEKSKLGDLRK